MGWICGGGGRSAVRGYSRCVGVQVMCVGGGAGQQGVLCVREGVRCGARGAGAQHGRTSQRAGAGHCMQHTATTDMRARHGYLRRWAARGVSTSGGAGAAAGAALSHGHVTPDTRSPAHTLTTSPTVPSQRRHRHSTPRDPELALRREIRHRNGFRIFDSRVGTQ